MQILFTVCDVPIAQPRQKHRAFMSGGHMRTGNYTPAKHPVNAFKASCRKAANAAYSGAPLEGPIGLTLVFVLPRPQGMIWKRRQMPRVRHTKKPDADNLAKSLKDSLSKLTWGDDSQVCYLSIEKWIASGDEQPHVEVVIETLDQYEPSGD